MGTTSRLIPRMMRAGDGTTLAYARLGSGPPLVVVPPVPFSNMTGDWAVPPVRQAYQRMAASLEVMLYDGRGTGASQRDVADVAVGVQAADLSHVVETAGFDRVALLAIYLATVPALTYAAANPERVSGLVLFGATIRGADAVGRKSTGALLGLIDEDWGLFTQSVAIDWLGWGAGEAGELAARSFERGASPGVAKAALSAYAAADIEALLPQVSAPTLVLHRRDGRQISRRESEALVAALPGGRLQQLEGDSASLFLHDPEGTADVIAAFLRPGLQLPSARPAVQEPGGLTTREREVLSLIAAGESNLEIAARLGLSVHTIERHAANVYAKIDARGRADATAWALPHGLA
jgi:DNA-binding CsgD family transcriptional regulator/pimeloyl-ACP methyl ester carboxylesterase